MQCEPVTDSWWLKFEGAQEHRAEGERMISALLLRADATLRVDTSHSVSRSIYTVDERPAVIVSDFLRGLFVGCP